MSNGAFHQISQFVMGPVQPQLWDSLNKNNYSCLDTASRCGSLRAFTLKSGFGGRIAVFGLLRFIHNMGMFNRAGENIFTSEHRYGRIMHSWMIDMTHPLHGRLNSALVSSES